MMATAFLGYLYSPKLFNIKIIILLANLIHLTDYYILNVLEWMAIYFWPVVYINNMLVISVLPINA